MFFIIIKVSVIWNDVVTKALNAYIFKLLSMSDYSVCVDLGGTTSKFSVFTSDEIICQWSSPTPENNIVDMIESEIRNLDEEKNRRKSESEKYSEKASLLSLNLPVNQKEFEKNLLEMQSFTQKMSEEKNSLDEKKTEISLPGSGP
jgi:hypothetical protein